MQMRSVYSSHIDEIGYDPLSQELAVLYSGPRGRLTVYVEVPPDVANNVVNAASVGTAIHDYIRGKFKFFYPEVE